MHHGVFFFHSYPIFENPYPLTIHESPVTCCEYVADCPVDLIPALYSVGSRQKRQGYSKKVGMHTSAGVHMDLSEELDLLHSNQGREIMSLYVILS